MNRTIAYVLCWMMVLGWGMTSAAQEPGNCEALKAAVNQAQTAYNKALGAWKQATVKVIQAEQAVTNVKDRLNKNDKAQIQVIKELEAAKADQATCAKASQDGPLAPLVDCSKVQGRINKAEKDLAALEAKNKQLEEELRSKQQEVEEREEDAANAHAAERQAAAALEKAKAAAAGCKSTAKIHGGDAVQSDASSFVIPVQAGRQNPVHERTFLAGLRPAPEGRAESWPLG